MYMVTTIYDRIDSTVISTQHSVADTTFYINFFINPIPFLQVSSRKYFLNSTSGKFCRISNKHSLSRTIQRVKIMSKFIFEAWP